MATKKLSIAELGAKAQASLTPKKKTRKKAAKKTSKKAAKKTSTSKKVSKDPLSDLRHCASVVKRAKQMIHDADARPSLSKKR